MSANWSNRTLWTGDNLDIMRGMNSESVDLIYLDPPFNSNRTYSAPVGSEAAGAAFTDTWAPSDMEEAWRTELADRNPAAHSIVGIARLAHGESMQSYLIMMAVRLLDMRRVLKSTGSIYLHCDPTASHYLKVTMDAIFGRRNFRNEVIWRRTSAHNNAKSYGRVHDVLLFYTVSNSYVWNRQYTAYDPQYVEMFFDMEDSDGRRWKLMDLTGAGITRNGKTGLPWRGIDVTAKGRHWGYTPETLDQMDAKGRVHWPKKPGGMPRLKQYPEDIQGVPLQDVITDIRPIHNLSKDRLGYPTQKPIALLERIILASSDPGDLVLDPFCGCGTTLVAADRLQRQWAGIDLSPLAAKLVLKRLREDRGALFDGVTHRQDVPVRTDPRRG